MTRKWMLIGIIAGIVLAVAGGWFFVRRSQNGTNAIRTVTAEPRTITQDITFTGRLTPATVSEVSFELPGTVAALFVEEGDTVEYRQALAVLDTSGINLELAVARATTASSQDKAKLAWEQARGDRQKTVAANAATIAKRRQAVTDAKRELDQAKQVHQQRAQESGDTAALTEAAIATLRAHETAWHAAQKTLTESLATVAQSNASATAAEATANAEYLSTIQAARGIAGLSSLEAQEGLVANKSSKHTLTAPFAGTVTAQHKTVGEAALAGQSVVTVATTDELELVATVTETDAIKLRLDMPATINFDALPSTQQWAAKVSFISPAATVIEGVGTYTVKLLVNENINDLPPGLSANITVHAAEAQGVLGVPRRAIIVRGTEEFVLVLQNDGTISTKPIVTGLLGSDGTAEVKEGLTYGARVVVNPGEISTADERINN